MRLAPVRAHAQRAGGLALTTTASWPSWSAGRPRSTGRRRSPRSAPRARTAPCATPRRRRAAARPARAPRCARERAQDPERQHDAALHVDRARAGQPLARPRAAAGESRAAMTVSTCPTSRSRRLPVPLQPQRPGRARARARSTGRARTRPPRAAAPRPPRAPPRRRATSPDGRRDPDQRAQLALRSRGDAPGDLVNPCVDATSLSCHERHRDRRPGTRLHARGHRRSPSRCPSTAASRRAALLPRRRDPGLHQAVLLLPRHRPRGPRRDGRRDLGARTSNRTSASPSTTA